MDAAEDAAHKLTLRLFGTFEVAIDGVPLPPVRTRKVQWLLALLALRPNREVERIWLAGLLWPESAHRQALFNLRQALSHLRSALGSAGGRLHTATSRTLLLDLTAASVDLMAFDAAVREGGAQALEQAIALYRGPLLQECSEEWVFSERQEREQRYLEALERLAETHLAQGEPTTAAAYLRRVIGTDPTREHSQRALMQALAATGDFAAVVQAYRALRLWLHKELHAEPDPATRALFEQIRHEAQRRIPVALPIPEAAAAPPIRLPHPITPLVGRAAEAQQIRAGLRTQRLVTLTGAGGIGKTRLAIAAAGEMAQEFTAGLFFVDLAPLTDPALVGSRVAAALQIQEEPGRPPSATLQDYLRARKLLLVLDNCEHLIEACAGLAGELLESCPQLHILATSRQALGTQGEMVWRIGPLTLPPAPPPASRADAGKTPPSEWMDYESVALFVQRAQQILPTFLLTRRNREAVVRICLRLEGMPLAIELAAARIRVLTAEQISARLQDRFQLLQDSRHTALPRHQTLYALIDWSYALLTPAEKRLLARLSVFTGGWTLEAAEVVCTDAVLAAEDLLELLASLVDQSLVVFEEDRFDGRYHMLETIRQYAREQASPDGFTPLRARHAAYFLALAEEATQKLKGPEQPEWLERLEAEHDNLRSALNLYAGAETGAEAGLRLSGALQRFWFARGHWREGREHLGRALSHRGAGGSAASRILALNGAAALALYSGDCPGAQALFEESLRRNRELGDAAGIADSLVNLGYVAEEQGDFVRAQTLYEEGLHLFRDLGAEGGIAKALLNLGNVCSNQGDFGRGQTLLEESLRLNRELANGSGIADALSSLGGVALAQGDYGRARNLIQESLGFSRQTGNRNGIAYKLIQLSLLALRQRDYLQARMLSEEGLRLYEALGNRSGLADALENIAEIDAAQANTGQAVCLWAAADAMRQRLGMRLPHPVQQKQERRLAELEALLGREAFGVAWQKGQALSQEQAIALAAS